MDKLIRDMKRQEGFEPNMYRCSSGKMSIGYGLNLEAGITEEEATALLSMRVAGLRARCSLTFAPFWESLSDNRQDVLVNMAYNIGLRGVLGFRKMLLAITHRNFKRAAEEMLDSKWATQVKGRAEELSNIMLEG